MPKRRASVSASATAAPGVLSVLPVCLWGILFVTLLWRALLALQISLTPALSTTLSAVSIHLPRLDQFVGWITLILWLLGQEERLIGTGGAGSLKQRRVGALLGIATTVGLSLAAGGILWDQMGRGEGADAGGTSNVTGIFFWLGEHLGLWGDVCLALLGLVAALRELRRIAERVAPARANTASPGLTVVELFRLAAVQWMLAWIGAMVMTWWQFAGRKDDLQSDLRVRTLQFILPAVGLLPNVLMLVGIGWWNQLAFDPAKKAADPIGPVRARAWLLSVLAINIAAILITRNATVPIAVGAFFMLFGVAMYLAGFPRGAWRHLGNARYFFPAAWAVFLAAILLLLLEHLFADALARTYFAAAWRHLFSITVPVVWLLALMIAAQSRHAGDKAERAKSLKENLRWSTIAAVAMLLGALVTVIVLILASLKQGDDQVPITQALVFGFALELCAILLIGMLLWRWLRLRG